MSCKVHFKDESSSLSHYGIKGQEWGVRRYQNEDGSLTPLGKRRYKQNKNIESEYRKAVAISALGNAGNVGGTALSVAAKSSIPKPEQPKKDDYANDDDYKVAQDKYKQDKEDYDNANKYASATEKASKDFKTSMDNKANSMVDAAEKERLQFLKDDIDLSDVSDDDLRSAINRIQMENTYKSLTSPTVDEGANKARQAIAVIGGLATATVTGLTIAKLVKDLKS